MHIIGISSIHALGAAKGPSTFQTYPCGGRGKARSPNNVQNSRVAACQMFLIIYIRLSSNFKVPKSDFSGFASNSSIKLASRRVLSNTS